MPEQDRIVALPADGGGAPAPRGDGAPYVQAKHANIGSPGEVVVADINFELGRGQAVALIGTNGSGKSTLLKTIVGLLPPLAGRISVFGDRPGGNSRRVAYL